MTEKKKPQQRHGFRTNEYIVYPAHGVGRIVSIEEQEIRRRELNHAYTVPVPHLMHESDCAALGHLERAVPPVERRRAVDDQHAGHARLGLRAPAAPWE